MILSKTKPDKREKTTKNKNLLSLQVKILLKIISAKNNRKILKKKSLPTMSQTVRGIKLRKFS